MVLVSQSEITIGADSHSNVHAPQPFKPTSALDAFDFEEVTPVIGREFPKLNIVDDILTAQNADDRLRELAVTSTSSSPISSVNH